MGATGRNRADRGPRAGANGLGDARADPRAAGAKAGAAKAAGAKAESPRKGPRPSRPTKETPGEAGAHGEGPARERSERRWRRALPSARLPRGPQALPREQVASTSASGCSRRWCECVEEHGYVATTISELVARARISRRSFYDHFRNKDECLLATYDTVIERLGRRLRESHDPAASWEEQLETFIRTLFDAAGDRPDAARLVCVEMGAAGPIGVQRWADGAERLQRYIVDGIRAGARAGHGARPGGEGDRRGGAQDPVYARRARPFEQVAARRPGQARARPARLDRLLLPLARGPAAAPARRRRASKEGAARRARAGHALGARRCRASAGCRAASTTCRGGSSRTTSASGSSTRSPTSRPRTAIRR